MVDLVWIGVIDGLLKCYDNWWYCLYVKSLIPIFISNWTYYFYNAVLNCNLPTNFRSILSFQLISYDNFQRLQFGTKLKLNQRYNPMNWLRWKVNNHLFITLLSSNPQNLWGSRTYWIANWLSLAPTSCSTACWTTSVWIVPDCSTGSLPTLASAAPSTSCRKFWIGKKIRSPINVSSAGYLCFGLNTRNGIPLRI